MTRREELAREAARLFAEKGYHGTSIGGARGRRSGVQKGSLYAHIEGKQDLLFETMRQGAEAFHGALDEIPEELPATEKIRLALRAHLRVVAGPARARHRLRPGVALPRRRAARAVRGRAPALRGARARLFREGREQGELRSDLDESVAALLFLSAANWAFTWLRPGVDTDAIADAFYAFLVDGMRGYSTPS